MTRTRWWLALPALALLVVTPSLTRAAEIRDKANLFSSEAVAKAQTELDRIEREYKVPIRIEVIESLNGGTIDKTLEQHALAVDAHGLYTLIAQKETKIEVGASNSFKKYLTRPREVAIRNAFVEGFKTKDFDAGLARGVAKIESTLSEAKIENGGAPFTATKAAPVGRRGPGMGGGRAQAPVVAPARSAFGMGSLVVIVLGILGVLLVVRILGAIFNAARGGGGYANQQGRMGGPGYGGGGPGYGGGGGGGGGGFMSSMFGGIGGALAGNWLYDQFSGRHHGSTDQTGYDGGAAAGADAPAEEGWNTPGDGGADWGGGGGGTAAPDNGGDWGGGSGGGGGDWGGGGDTGGGGGDWGGGGGGGDWGGGGGGDGGSW